MCSAGSSHSDVLCIINCKIDEVVSFFSVSPLVHLLIADQNTNASGLKRKRTSCGMKGVFGLLSIVDSTSGFSWR